MWKITFQFSVCTTLLTLILKFYKSISTKYGLPENITTLNSFAHGFLNYTTLNMLTDIHDAELDKRQRQTFQRLDDISLYSSKNSGWKTQKKFCSQKSSFMPQNFEINEPLIAFLIDKSQFKINEPHNIVTLPSTSLQNTKV